MKIKFINTTNVEIIKPVPASKLLPDWYKNFESYHGENQKTAKMVGEIHARPSTIKKCLPVFDSLTAGYIIKTHVDIDISAVDGSPYFQWPSLNAIEFHPIWQAETHPQVEDMSKSYDSAKAVPKYTNPWGIKTPKGYSCLFLPPVHRKNIINILPGIVDTDSYFAPIKFVFTLSDPSFKGIIPAGTPVVQVIPFKRENWVLELAEDDTEAKSVGSRIGTVFFDAYKTMFWNKKSYK